jgi:hypothetical protein
MNMGQANSTGILGDEDRCHLLCPNLEVEIDEFTGHHGWMSSLRWIVTTIMAMNPTSTVVLVPTPKTQSGFASGQ